jgi:hypothetical protein
MIPTFQTKRLLVYKLSMEHDPNSAFDLYLGYERNAPDHPYRVLVECCSASGSNCVLWVETHGRERQGFALELLNGIARHQRFKEPMYPNYTISGTADTLFERHEEAFKAER